MKHQSGFTLTEMLVYMGLFAIILVILTEILISLLKVQLDSQAVSGVDQDSRYLVTRLNYDLNRAQSISFPANLGAHGSTLRIIINSSTYTYNLLDGSLVLTINSLPPQVLNSADTTITNLDFLRLGNPNGLNSIKLNLTVTSKVIQSSGPELKNVDTVISLRPNL